MTLGLLLCLALAPDPPRDRWFAEDKLKHLFASFVATSVTASVARAAGADPRPAAWIGAGGGVAMGVWKELRDANRGVRPSARDLTWDLAGVGGATAVMLQVR